MGWYYPVKLDNDTFLFDGSIVSTNPSLIILGIAKMTGQDECLKFVNVGSGSLFEGIPEGFYGTISDYINIQHFVLAQ